MLNRKPRHETSETPVPLLSPGKSSHNSTEVQLPVSSDKHTQKFQTILSNFEAKSRHKFIETPIPSSSSGKSSHNSTEVQLPVSSDKPAQDFQSILSNCQRTTRHKITKTPIPSPSSSISDNSTEAQPMPLHLYKSVLHFDLSHLSSVSSSECLREVIDTQLSSWAKSCDSTIQKQLISSGKIIDDSSGISDNQCSSLNLVVQISSNISVRARDIVEKTSTDSTKNSVGDNGHLTSLIPLTEKESGDRSKVSLDHEDGHSRRRIFENEYMKHNKLRPDEIFKLPPNEKPREGKPISVFCLSEIPQAYEQLENFYEIDQRCAEEYLKEKNVKSGTYLLRPSHNKGFYTLSVRCRPKTVDSRQEICHYEIRSVRNGVSFIDSFGETKPFASLTELINYYSSNSGLRDRLTRPYNGDMKWLQELAIKMDDVKIENKLGAGHFANVFKGILKNGQTVAVKSLLSGGSLSMKDFLDEVSVMHKLRHERLVTLIGFCADVRKGRVKIVMELMSNGSLKDLLLKDGGKEIQFFHLMFMAIQVAEGMSFLESENYVHRDLRAANVLVGESHDVKIADFGLTRILDNYYGHLRYYQKAKDTAFPFKWTAPEAVRTLKFTAKSDVWSFGILLYEICTYGEEIYLGMSNNDAVEWVIAGNRLKKPIDHHCPKMLHDLMLACWKEDPIKRPSFQESIQTLKEIKTMYERMPRRVHSTRVQYL